MIDTPDRHKARRLCHVNMLKKYHGKETDGATVFAFQNADETEQETPLDEVDDDCVVFRNSDALRDVKNKLSH